MMIKLSKKIVKWPRWKPSPQVQNGHSILSATRLPISPLSRFFIILTNHKEQNTYVKNRNGIIKTV